MKTEAVSRTEPTSRYLCYRKRCDGPAGSSAMCSLSRFRGWCDYCSVGVSIGALAISVFVAAMFLSALAGMLLIVGTSLAALAWITSSNR